MLKITDKKFRYTPSFNTDLRKKFKRMEQERRQKEAQEAVSHVVPMLSARKVKHG